MKLIVKNELIDKFYFSTSVLSESVNGDDLF